MNWRAVDGECRARRGRGTPFVDYRPQVQPLPHWQIAPQRHPGLRVSVFFLDI